jgi:hypothetical protein
VRLPAIVPSQTDISRALHTVLAQIQCAVATTITTSSDERLKENLEPITNALATVNNLRTVTGNYKADPSRNVAFFIAQDMQEHFPQAFEGGNPDAFGINYNWTNPLLAAAIKELKAIVDAQAVRIAELEGAK